VPDRQSIRALAFACVLLHCMSLSMHRSLQGHVSPFVSLTFYQARTRRTENERASLFSSVVLFCTSAVFLRSLSLSLFSPSRVILRLPRVLSLSHSLFLSLSLSLSLSPLPSPCLPVRHPLCGHIDTYIPPFPRLNRVKERIYSVKRREEAFRCPPDGLRYWRNNLG
jgi:hypothetical protein